MSVPDVILTVRDGSLGVIPPLATGTCLKIGTCQLGTVNTIYSFSDPQLAVTTLGQGPLTEAVVRSLGIGGGPVLAIPANPTTAGSAGAVTKNGTGLSVITVAGAANDAYSVAILITAGGVNPAGGTATFQYSLDGGTTWSPVTSVPVSGTYVIPNSGLTLTFSAATLVAADTYTFVCTSPGFSLSDLNAALTAALASSYSFGFVHVVGPASTAAGAAAMAAAVDVQMSTAAVSKRFIWGIIEVPQDTDANIMTAFANTASTRVMAAAGFAVVASAINGRQLSRSAGWVLAERTAAVTMGTDLGRVKDGSLPGVVSISRDERATPALDNARLATLRTIIGRQGFYINNGRMLSPAGSDYQLAQYRRIIDAFSTICYTALLNFLNDSVTVDATTGYILEASAQNIEAYVGEQAKSVITRPGEASSLTITVNRATNIISTGTLPVSGRVVPNGYNKSITADIGLSNPALTLKAA